MWCFVAFENIVIQVSIFKCCINNHSTYHSWKIYLNENNNNNNKTDIEQSVHWCNVRDSSQNLLTLQIYLSFPQCEYIILAMWCGLMLKTLIILGVYEILKDKSNLYCVFQKKKKKSKESGKKPYGTLNHKGNYTSLYEAFSLEKRVNLLFIIIFYEVTSMKSWKHYHMNSKG